jgi:redox-sensing transcriptional repressor
MGLTPSQIRQDFSCFGEFGQQGYGYNVDILRQEISTILGTKQNFSVILVGVGNLGHALIENFGFERLGFDLKAAFDVNPNIVGMEISGIKIYSSDQLDGYLRENRVDIAVLAVPRRMAKDVAAKITANGVRAIWNFTNIDLEITSPGVLVENIHFSDSLLTLSYYLANCDADSPIVD